MKHLKNVSVLVFWLASAFVYADSFNYTYISAHHFITPLQDPDDFCYPPQGQAFIAYFSKDRCYYRFNNDCNSAQLVKFDPSTNPNQANNRNFFALCNIKNPSLELGPEMMLYVDPASTATQVITKACVLLSNQSDTQTSEAHFQVYEDPNHDAPDPNIHVPGCLANEVGRLDLQDANPETPPTYQIICENIITGNTLTRTAVINNLPDVLNNQYTQCPTS